MGEAFQRLLDQKIGIELFHLNYKVSIWINDGLMAIFFLLVGLEIKREIIEGELSTFKSASLPIVAALGGIISVSYTHLDVYKRQIYRSEILLIR